MWPFKKTDSELRDKMSYINEKDYKSGDYNTVHEVVSSLYSKGYKQDADRIVKTELQKRVDTTTGPKNRYYKSRLEEYKKKYQ